KPNELHGGKSAVCSLPNVELHKRRERCIVDEMAFPEEEEGYEYHAEYQAANDKARRPPLGWPVAQSVGK
ncbi:hypothetical protein FRC16_002566, partial [Serendipita sp. 398]